MAFSQPVVKDDFLYNGDLFVDVGNLNRHKRASVSEITEILRPDLKKPKNGTIVKDPVGHWYEAQLIHYGLPPSKDKARAKMRLLENLNQSKLKVPPHITAIESDLKKEFSAAERKAKAQYKASLGTAQLKPKQSPSTSKRKTHGDQSTHTTINVNVNIGQESSPNHSSQPTPKKRKVQTARRGDSKSVPSPELSHAASQEKEPAAGVCNPRPKQTARRSASSSLSFRPNVAPSGAQSAAKAPRADARFGEANPDLSAYADIKPKKERKPAMKKEVKAKQEPAIKKESLVKKEPKVRAEPGSTKGPLASSSRSALAPLGLINGIYEVSCPEIEREWDDDGFTIVLTLDSPSIWGQYDFGMFSGIFHVPQRPFAASNNMFPFQWRGRENGEGEMSFGDDCIGGISFLGNGYIEGWINVYGQCRFEGTRRDGPGTAVSNAIDIRNEWDGYNEEEYENERIGRWH